MEKNNEMSRIIKVYGPGVADREVREVTLEEAMNIMKNTIDIGSIVVNPKTNETIWEIGPEIDEIEIIEFIGGG